MGNNGRIIATSEHPPVIIKFTENEEEAPEEEQLTLPPPTGWTPKDTEQLRIYRTETERAIKQCRNVDDIQAGILRDADKIQYNTKSSNMQAQQRARNSNLNQLKKAVQKAECRQAPDGKKITEDRELVKSYRREKRKVTKARKEEGLIMLAQKGASRGREKYR